MPRVSLLTKLLVAILAPTLLTFAGFAILGHIAASRALEAELGRRLASLAAVTAAQISEESVALLGPGDESSRTYRNLRRRLLDVRDAAAVSRVYLFAVDGTSRVDSADLPIGSRDYTLETSRSELRRVFPDGGRMGVAVSSLLFRGRDGALYKSGFAPIRPQTEGAAPQFAVGVDGSAALYADLLGLRQTLFSVGLLGALSLVVLAVGLKLRLTKPLRRLRESARLIGAGVFDQKVWQPDAARAGTGGGVTGGDEVAELARGLEAMRDGLRVRDERLQMMLAGIAHEVRNPLGGMELFAGLLAEELAAAPMGSGAAAGGPDLTAAQGYVARVQRELRHLQAVVSDFLEYARRPRPQLSRVGVADLLSDVRDSVVSTAQVRVQLAPVAADLCVRADPTQLRRALLNLAQNAVQACTDATILVTAGQLDAAMGTAGVQILFTNTGPTECLLQGYPGVALAGADHQQVGTDAARRPATIPLLALAPGGQGAAQFLVANGTGYEPPTATPCSQAPVAGLRVYAPGSRKLVFVPAPLQVCTGVRPTIGPVEAPGSTS